MQQFTTKKLKSHFSLFKKITAIAGFLKLGQLMGGKFGQKWPKTAWKLQNQHFWGKTVGGHGGEANFSGSVGGGGWGPRDPSPPTRGNPE